MGRAWHYFNKPTKRGRQGYGHEERGRGVNLVGGLGGTLKVMQGLEFNIKNKKKMITKFRNKITGDVRPVRNLPI